MLDCIYELAFRDQYQALGQSRDGEGLGQGVIVSRVALGQHEGLAAFPAGGHIGEIGAVEQRAHSLAAEDYPPTVGGPTQPGFALARIQFQPAGSELSRGVASLEINCVEVALGVVSWPAAIGDGAEEEPPPIRTEAGLSDAETGLPCWQQQLRLPPGFAFRVVGNAHQVVLGDGMRSGGERGHVSPGIRRAAVVEIAAIRAPRRRRHQTPRLRQAGDFADYVFAQPETTNPAVQFSDVPHVVARGVQHQARLADRADQQVGPGMPRNEAHRALDGRRHAVADHQQAVLVVGAADVHSERVGVVVPQQVTVAAVVGKAAIFEDGRLLKGPQLTLEDTHLAPGVMGRMDFAIEHDRVNFLPRDAIGDGGELPPLMVVTEHRHIQV